MKTYLYKIFSGILIAVYLSSVVLSGVASATKNPVRDPQAPLAKHEPKRGINPETGKLSFIGNGDPIDVPGVSDVKGISPQERAQRMANAYAKEFGLKNPSQELKLLKSEKDSNGKDVSHFQQMYQGIPVIAGEMIVNTNANGELLSISGEVSSDLTLDTKPATKSQEALKTAADEIGKLYRIDSKQLTTTAPELWIFDESLLTASTRPVELAWRMEVTAKGAMQPIRELVLVNAQTGAISWHINQVDNNTSTALLRATSDAKTGIEKAGIPSTLDAAGPGWYVSPSGNDANACNVPTLPCATIQGAINKAPAGDTIFVAEGTYSTGYSYIISISDSYYHFSGGWDTTFTTRTGRSVIDGRNSLKGIQILTSNAVPVSVFEHFIIQNCLGGGIYIQASGMILTDMIIRNNTVNAYGGAAIFVSSGDVVINDSLLMGNKNTSTSDYYNGAAISHRGSVTLNNTTVMNNSSTNSGGGGIYTWAGYNLTLNNSTVSGNSAARNGGGLLLDYGATVNINNSTIAYNSAQNGGGIYIKSGSGTYNVRNSIISNNSASVSTADCYAALNILNYSLIGDATNCSAVSDTGNLKNMDPLLDPVITGWPGFHRISSNSPVIDQADPSDPGTCLSQDQRGVPRSLPCDMGAIEYTSTGPAAILTVVSGSGQEAVPWRTFSSPLVLRVTDQYYNPVDNVNVTFTAPSLGASSIFTDTASKVTSVLTGVDGIATSPTLIANATSGSYGVNATVENVSSVATFLLKNLYPTLSLQSGSPQATQVLTTFGDPLKVLVQYAPGAPVAGVEVTFAAPASGASGTFADTSSNTTTAVTDANGIATSAAFTANDTSGSFTVVATIPDPALSVSFQLTNLAAVNCTVNNGTGAPSLFLPYKQYNCGKTSHGVVVGDFNHDGRKDIALSSSGTLMIFLQDNNGNLVQPRVYAGTYNYLAAGDLNSDGLDDIAAVDTSNTIGIFLQKNDGTLAYRRNYSTGTNPDAIAVGDVNNDGLKDVIVSHWNSAFIGIFTQNPNGTLNPMVSYPSVTAGYDDIAIGDVNNDGLNDVVKMNGQLYANPNLQVYLQNANGTLGVAIPYSLGCNCLGSGIGIGDVTGDGRADVVMSYGGNRPDAKIAVFAQDSNGNLQAAISYLSYDIPKPVEIADVNSDNNLDVLTLHSGWGRAGSYLQQPGGSLGNESLYALPNINSSYNPQDLSIGDVNNDGLPDLLISDYTGLVVLYRNTTIPPTPTITPTFTATFTPGPTLTPSSTFTPSPTFTAGPGPSRTPGPTSTPGSSPTPVPSSSTGSRTTYTALGAYNIPGTFLCDQNQSICTNGADPDADKAHQYAADTFMFYNIHHHRNGIDNVGSTIVSTVHYGINYQNAGWTGFQMVYGDGMAADDVVGHELTHGVTQYTSGLIYYGQSGAINESFSDVWGEFIDQTNNSGNDSLSVKWLLGEDTPLGVIRSMSNPPAYGDPDKMSSPYYYIGSYDNGGVHINSGVNNKAAYLMVEGATFNGRTILGIGLNKTAAIYYEAQANLLTAGANYNDLYYALNQACQNLMGGSDGITQNDCIQVQLATEAVEMIPVPLPTPTPTITLTPTLTPSNTATATLTFTPTYTPTPTTITLVLQPDAATGIDTYIYSSSKNSNFGTAVDMGVGEDNNANNRIARSLIKFDLSSIPANATIHSATLSLWTNTDLSSNNRLMRVYRLKVQFNETQATWNVSASGVSWQAAGASGTNDRESTDIGSVTVLNNEALNVEKQIVLTPSKIQEMVNGTFVNRGFILVADTESNDRFNYKTSDSTTSSQRPKLVVQYVVPPNTSTPSATPTSTYTLTPTATFTRTSTPSYTPTSTISPTVTSTRTATMTATYTATTTPSLFKPYVNFPVGAGRAVAIGDFNSDGLQDVAMTNSAATTSQLFVFLQQSDGSLGTPTSYDAGYQPFSLAVGDLNHDGRTDLVATNMPSNEISVFLQQANGTFAPRVTYSTISGRLAVAVGDLNGDGWDDVAVSGNDLGVFLQNAAGTLNPMVSYSSPGSATNMGDIAIGDVNNDGKKDVIKQHGSPSFLVYLQKENGALASALSYSLQNCSPYCGIGSLTTGDVTGDGLADIIITAAANRPNAKIAVFKQAQDGSLQQSALYDSYDIPVPVVVSDVNQDALADILVGNSSWNQISLFSQRTDGTLNPYILYLVPYSDFGPFAMAVGDINHDGLPDVAVADANSGLVVLYHSASFLPNPPTPTRVPVNTATTTATLIPTATKTFTPIQPTRTPTFITFTPSPLPTFTATNTSLPTATATSPLPIFTSTNTPLPTATFTPTSTVAASSLTFMDNADSYVIQSSPNANYGTNAQLWMDGDAGATYQSYLKFSVSGISGTVKSAILRVYSTSSTVDGPAVYATTNDWAETGISWNTQPALTGSVLDDKGAIATGVWTEYNVTAAMTGDGTYSFVFVPTSTDSVSFSSREGAQPPQLILTIAP